MMMKKWLAGAAMISVAAVALAGCASYQSASGKDANGTYDPSKTGGAKNAISLTEYRSVSIGTSCASLESTFGPPADKQVYDAAGYHDEMWSYNDVTDSGDFTVPQYMFDCENGSVTSKSNM